MCYPALIYSHFLYKLIAESGRAGRVNVNQVNLVLVGLKPRVHRLQAISGMYKAFGALHIDFFQNTTSYDWSKMSKKIIESAYKMIGGLTPLKNDCGRLCGSACCHSEGYMLLFPYEEELLSERGFKIFQKELAVYGAVQALTCNGACDREMRPLSCRIFPLAPKFIEGELFLRIDPRARRVCSLSHKSILSFDKEFTNIIKKTLNMMCHDDRMSRYLEAISNIADKYQDILS